ncbi:hypothetical protein ACTXT7_001456 [Hymenolepis weldensis]
MKLSEFAFYTHDTTATLVWRESANLIYQPGLAFHRANSGSNPCLFFPTFGLHTTHQYLHIGKSAEDCDYFWGQ